MKNKTSPARRPFTRFTSSLCCVGLASLAASACSGLDSGVEDLGDTEVITQDLGTPPTEPFYTSPTEFAGRWIGIADDVLALGVATGESLPPYRFPSGSSSIVLDLQFIDDPSFFPDLEGTITFGAGEPPPPPTDPSVGYPVGLSYADLYTYEPEASGGRFGDPSPLPPLEGFVYRIQQTSFLDDRTPLDSVPDGVLLLRYSTGEYLNAWCELQTPVPDGDGGYACLPPYDQISSNEAGECFLGTQDLSTCPPDLDQLSFDEQAAALSECLQVRDQPIDCDKLFLCSGFDAPDNGRCACDETGCFGNFISSVFNDDALITLRRNGDELVGTITEGWFLNPRGLRTPLGTIRFQRVAE